MMIDLDAYFGEWMPFATAEHVANAMQLLERVTKLQGFMVGKGILFPTNPKTGTEISGSTYGGFRPQDCGIGAPNSAHKQGLAVDLFDPKGEIDLYLYNNQLLLDQYDIYIEHPDSTPGWSHWSIKKPGSGKRIFYP